MECGCLISQASQICNKHLAIIIISSSSSVGGIGGILYCVCCRHLRSLPSNLKTPIAWHNRQSCSVSLCWDCGMLCSILVHTFQEQSLQWLYCVCVAGTSKSATAETVVSLDTVPGILSAPEPQASGQRPSQDRSKQPSGHAPQCWPMAA